ncbi:TetR/AcrR family transcriptional regulator, partial [Streptomyces sp. NPDC055078]
MPKQTQSEESRTRTRTRRAILDAAVAVLGEEPKASMGQIAAAAGVARSTLQRYFADRPALLAALSAYARERLDEAARQAGVDEGPALEALSRLVAEYFAIGDIVMLVVPGWEAEGWAGDYSEADRVMAVLLDRGRREGVLDEKLSDNWIEQLMWGTLYT